jgi:hypothetical protein
LELEIKDFTGKFGIVGFSQFIIFSGLLKFALAFCDYLAEIRNFLSKIKY